MSGCEWGGGGLEQVITSCQKFNPVCVSDIQNKL